MRGTTVLNWLGVSVVWFSTITSVSFAWGGQQAALDWAIAPGEAGRLCAQAAAPLPPKIATLHSTAVPQPHNPSAITASNPYTATLIYYSSISRPNRNVCQKLPRF
ncbi:MAG: hypothetical protein Fur0046_02900 [Cyanobacteria bacterium J069]